MRSVLSYLLPCILLIASCSEAIRIDPGVQPATCLAVDGIITDRECHQVVRLSLTEDSFRQDHLGVRRHGVRVLRGAGP